MISLRVTRSKAPHAACVIALALAMGSVSAAQAQNVFFQSTPTTNSCDGWILWPGADCPADSLGTRVLTCRLYDITGNTAGGVFMYAPNVSATFPPGYTCSFHDCAPAALQLTCFQLTFENKLAVVKDPVTIVLDRKTKSAKARVFKHSEDQ